MRKEFRKANHWRKRPGGKIKRRLYKINKFNPGVASLDLINSLNKEVTK